LGEGLVHGGEAVHFLVEVGGGEGGDHLREGIQLADGNR
jgi:hypothetical protein